MPAGSATDIFGSKATETCYNKDITAHTDNSKMLEYIPLCTITSA